jgi:hypothetical protein
MAISIAETCSCRYSLQYTLCWWTICFIDCKRKGLKIWFYVYTNRQDAMLVFMINPVTDVNSRTSLKQITKIPINIHKITILDLILYRCDTILHLQARKYLCVLRMCQNNALVRIFGTKKEELKGRQQKLHASGLRNLLFFATHYIIN